MLGGSLGVLYYGYFLNRLDGLPSPAQIFPSGSRSEDKAEKKTDQLPMSEESNSTYVSNVGVETGNGIKPAL